VCIFLAAAIAAALNRVVLAIFTPLPFLAFIFFWRNRLLPSFSRYSRAKLLTIAALYLSCFVFWLPPTQLSGLFSSIVSPLPERLHAVPIPDPLVFNAVIVFLIFLVVLTLNVFWHRNEISHTIANPVVDDLVSRHRDFQASLSRYCNALIAELDRYDQEVNWSDYELTPLEAEVETERSARLRPRIASDLVEAIRRDRDSTVFLVLGDPGSGKSVSLRRLVRLLCRQAQDTGVVPVYVNLREYPAAEVVTSDSLVRFIRETALRQTGRDGRAFIDAWYEVFRKSGRLFFIIDSFDEVPAVLDSDDRSDSHKEISASFDRFFTQEVQTCRAVLSSRHFRAPVGTKGTRLVIRPFSETQIRQAMQTWLLGQGIDSTQYIRRLFRERPHLVPLLRNPFTAELIAEYARTAAGDKLPENMFSVFDHYLSERFASDQSALDRLGVSPENLREAAALIARRMYERADIGLEADVDRITKLLPDSHETQAGKVIEALRYSRIARVGGHDRRRFSFVHRRFAEFFVVDSMRLSKETPQVESIPSDSRWRDCLVMYCGIAELAIRRGIAEFCWNVIDASRDNLLQGRVLEARDAVHCSRFLAEAFRSDHDAIASFRDSLGAVIIELIRAPDLLVAKIAAEMIPLLDEVDQRVAINSAFETYSPWVCDTTLGSCRHLAKLDDSTNESMRNYLGSIPPGEFLQRFSDLNFSMSLSDAFRKQRRDLWIDFVELTLLPCLAALCFFLGAILFPKTLMSLAVMALLSVFIFPRTFKSKNRPSRRTMRLITGLLFGMRGDFIFASLRFFVGVASFFLVERLFHIKWLIDQQPNGFTQLILGIPRFILPPLFALAFWGFLIAAVRIIVNPPPFRKIQLLLAPKRVVSSAFVAVAFVVVSGAFMWFLISVMTKLLDLLPAKYVIWGFVILLYGLGGGWLLIRVVKAGLQNLIDRNRLNRNGFPTRVSSLEMYEACLAYRSTEVRRLYLEGLRRRRVPLVGELTPAPKELMDSPLVAEELARLREQWLGLAA